jgi:hypothetical protein
MKEVERGKEHAITVAFFASDVFAHKLKNHPKEI